MSTTITMPRDKFQRIIAAAWARDDRLLAILLIGLGPAPAGDE